MTLMDKKSFNLLCKYFALSKVIALIGILFSLLVMNSDIKYMPLNFDAEHYTNISLYGYIKDYQYAFFPLYPLLIKLVSLFGVSSIVSGIIISNLFHFLSGYILIKLNNSYFKFKEENLLIIFFLSINAVFFSSIYTESLFLFLTLYSYYLYKNNNWYLCGLVLGLSVATRNVGSILFFSIFIELLINKEKFINIIKIYIPATIISCLYPIYLYIYTGNFFKFISVQEECWGAEFTLPLTNIIKDLIYLINTQVLTHKITIILSLFSIIVAIYLISINFKKEYLSLIIYLSFGILVPLLTRKSSSMHMAGMTSVFRYVYGLFPMYTLPLKKYNKLYIYVNIIIAVLLSIFYYSDVFIA